MAIKSDILKSLVPFDDGIRQRNLQSRVDTLYGKDRQANPFLDKNGNLFNKYINYQSVLNNPNVSTAAKTDFLNYFGGKYRPIADDCKFGYIFDYYNFMFLSGEEY